MSSTMAFGMGPWLWYMGGSTCEGGGGVFHFLQGMSTTLFLIVYSTSLL